MRGFFKVLPLEKEPEYSLESLLVCVSEPGIKYCPPVLYRGRENPHLQAPASVKISAVKLMVVAVGIP